MTSPALRDQTAAWDTDSGVETLTYGECLDLLAMEQVGRLAVVVDGYPQVFCVNYRLDDFVVVFRTHIGTKLCAANHANIGFEVDHLDAAARTGWSVLIEGMAEDITGQRPGVVTDRARQAGVESWVDGDKSRLVRVIPARITGRRIPAHELAWATDSSGYL
ncbi:MAG: pyridoxamine 5'-phosphate oxidase family protein [Actinomycetota bacterium]|nr:pyridoxamine 5'-phosphate oxidase family protein [Actinomycetota bacterium]